MASALKAPRVPSPAEFPDVVIHTDLQKRDNHIGYSAAKSGDADWALGLALDLAQGATAMRSLSEAIGPRLQFTCSPWLRVEAVSGEIVQINQVGHTRAPSFQRLVTPAMFDGPVQTGQAYVLVDDHIGLGGTLAAYGAMWKERAAL